MDTLDKMFEDVEAPTAETTETRTGAFPKTERLGEKLVKYRAITQKQLDHALRISQETGELLGMVLINDGAITQEALLRVMHMSGKKSRLGEILLREEAITGEDLEQALEEQKRTGKQLGQILIDNKKITEKKYLQALSRNMNMPIKRLKGFVPRTSLNEIVKAKVSIMCEAVVYMDSPQLLELVVAAPYDGLLDDLRILMPDKGIKVYLTYPDELKNAIREYNKLSSTTAVRYHTDAEREEAMPNPDENKQAVVGAVNEILNKAVRARATDIHISPTEFGGMIRIRKDGKLKDLPVTINMRRYYPQMIARIKILTGSMDINERWVPQKGRFSAGFKDEGDEHTIDFKVATVLNTYGEGLTIKILDPREKRTDLEALEFSEPLLDQYKELLDNTEGIILVTGPAGSGKTSTLYATLNTIMNRFPQKKIMTAEETIEFRYEGDEVSQSQIMPSRGVGHAELVESFLDHDPEIIMISEIRDSRTAELAIQAALNGILVIAGLNAANATAAAERLTFMGVNTAEFLNVTKGILSQRLISRTCPECAVEYEPADLRIKQFFGNIPTKDVTFYHGKGCGKCKMTGMMGRTPLAELWIPDDFQKSLVYGPALPNEVRRDALNKGMHSYYADGVFKMSEKLATLKQLTDNIPNRNVDKEFYEENSNLLI